MVAVRPGVIFGLTDVGAGVEYPDGVVVRVSAIFRHRLRHERGSYRGHRRGSRDGASRGSGDGAILVVGAITIVVRPWAWAGSENAPGTLIRHDPSRQR